MPIDGYATLEGTARYRERFKERAAENYFRLEENLWLSSIGIGTYLGKWDEATDERYTEAIVFAAEHGANLIDTAANYRFQRSERSIGAALRHLTEGRICERDEVVICTKGGYLPFDGAPPEDARRYVEETFVRTGIADFSDIVQGSHCMTPRYLQSQIDQSLRNMNLSSVDVYYIHNPESQLAAISREEFEKRFAQPLSFLNRTLAMARLGCTALRPGTAFASRLMIARFIRSNAWSDWRARSEAIITAFASYSFPSILRCPKLSYLRIRLWTASACLC